MQDPGGYALFREQESKPNGFEILTMADMDNVDYDTWVQNRIDDNRDPYNIIF